MKEVLTDLPGPDPEKEAAWQVRYDNAMRRFNELSEEDQILHLLSRKLGAVRQTVVDFESRLKLAREYVRRDCGPKFTDRVFGTPELLAKLKLEPTEQELNSSITAKTVTLD